MNEADKQELINLCLKMFCAECGKREHDYVELDSIELLNDKEITIPKVPTIRCIHCGSLSYPSFSMHYIDAYKAQISH